MISLSIRYTLILPPDQGVRGETSVSCQPSISRLDFDEAIKSATKSNLMDTVLNVPDLN